MDARYANDVMCEAFLCLCGIIHRRGNSSFSERADTAHFHANSIGHTMREMMMMDDGVYLSDARLHQDLRVAFNLPDYSRAAAAAAAIHAPSSS